MKFLVQMLIALCSFIAVAARASDDCGTAFMCAQAAKVAKEKIASFDSRMAGKTAYVLPPYSKKSAEAIPRSEVLYILYPSEKCQLPITNASNMRRAEIFNRGVPDVGCWGGVLDPDPNAIVVLGPSGTAERYSLSAFAKTTVQRDGSYKRVQ